MDFAALHSAVASERRRRLLLLAAGGQALLTIVFWSHFVARPHALGFDETQIANLAWYWDHGTLPYFDFHALPAVFNPYGPVFTWLVARLSGGAVGVYWLGRAISLGCLLVSAILIVRAGGRGGWALLAALLLFSVRPVWEIACRCRVDLLAVTLSFAGFLLATRARGRGSAAGAILLLALATQVKATAVAAPLALVWALWPTARRRAMAIGGGWLLLTVACFAALSAASGGALAENLFRSAGQFGRGLDLATRPLTTSPFWLLATALAWRCSTASTRAGSRPVRCYLAVTWAITAVTGSNWGSSWNYLLEFYLTLALLSAQLWEGLDSTPANGRRTVAGLLLLHLLISAAYLWVEGRHRLQGLERVIAEIRQSETQLSPWLRAGERVVVVDALAGARDVLLRAGQPNVLEAFDLRPMPSGLIYELGCRAIQTGLVDRVLCGTGLDPLDPCPKDAR